MFLQAFSFMFFSYRQFTDVDKYLLLELLG